MIDLKLLAAAIKCAEEDLHLQRDIDDPEVNKVRALVAAAKAYQPMREALEEIAAAMPELRPLERAHKRREIALAALNPAGPA